MKKRVLGSIMAGAVLAIVPIILLFLILQKYIMTGMSKAAIAKAEGVECKTARTMNFSVHQAIIQQAKDSDCDLICMASHGRKGIAGILLGSETQRVLVNSSIPVLVHRAA